MRKNNEEKIIREYRNMRENNKEKTIMMIRDKTEGDEDDGFYNVYYHCPIGKQKYIAKYNCVPPNFGDIYEGFCNEVCQQNCIVEQDENKHFLERQVKQIHECPFV